MGVIVFVDRLYLLPHKGELCRIKTETRTTFYPKEPTEQGCSAFLALFLTASPLPSQKIRPLETPWLTAWGCVFLLNIFIVQSDSPSSFFWFFRKVLPHFTIWAIILMPCLPFYSQQVKPWDSGWSIRLYAHDLSRANQNLTCDWYMDIGKEKVFFCWCCKSETVWFWDSWQPSCHQMRACLQNKAKRRMRARGRGRVMMTSCDKHPLLLPSTPFPPPLSQHIWTWIYTYT